MPHHNTNKVAALAIDEHDPSRLLQEFNDIVKDIDVNSPFYKSLMIDHEVSSGLDASISDINPMMQESFGVNISNYITYSDLTIRSLATQVDAELIRRASKNKSSKKICRMTRSRMEKILQDKVVPTQDEADIIADIIQKDSLKLPKPSSRKISSSQSPTHRSLSENLGLRPCTYQNQETPTGQIIDWG